MTKKGLFVTSATASFFAVIHITLKNEVKKAERDLKQGAERKAFQLAVERLAEDVRTPT